MRASRWSWVVAFVCLLATPSVLADKLPLYLLEGNRTQAYLLGSIHALPSDFYPLPKAIDRAYKKSDGIVLEVDVSKVTDEQMWALTRELGYYQDGSNVGQHLHPDTTRLLNDYLRQKVVPINVAQMRPWLIGTTIGLMELAAIGYLPEYGVDQHFMQRAIDDKKPIMQLETIRQQLEVMAADPADIQDLSLRSSLKEMHDMEAQIGELVVAWQAGDVERMYDISTESAEIYPELKPQFDRIIDGRNITMAEDIKLILADNRRKTWFIVVGALHLGGPTGLVKLLDDEFKITQIER